MKRLNFLILLALMLVVGVSIGQAQSGGGYDLTWNTIAGGGATSVGSTGGSYSLGGTIGQSDAGSMSGGSYQLNGGFWGGAGINYNIYLPLMLKNA